MPNPFQQRASEYQRSDTEFLATLTPSLFRIALDTSEHPELLLSKAAVFSAPPGFGKTTMARFFQYTTLCRLVEQLQREPDPAYKELFEFAVEREFIRERQVVVCGARVSLERDYRELSLIGYSKVRAHELMISLISARAVLAWKQMFLDSGVALNRVHVRPTVAGAARLEHLGNGDFDALAKRASEVAALIYGATARFIPPDENELLARLGESFFPLLAISHFEIEGQPEPVLPLLMVDDAHWIDREQHAALITHLTLREMAIGRWVFQRMEALDMAEALLWGANPLPVPGIKRPREVEDIRLTQAYDENRGAGRRNFRNAAEEVTARYMVQLHDLTRHGIKSLNGLNSRPEPTTKQIEFAFSLLEETATELAIPRPQLEQIRDRVSAFLSKRPELPGSVLGPAMTNILLHRQYRRKPQRSFFDANDEAPEPVVVDADLEVAAGAQVQLWHKCQVPFLGGFETLADLGTENVETFLQFAWQLVKLLETQVVVGGGDTTLLTVRQQHDALAREARQIVDSWSFPHALSVRQLAESIAVMCVKRSLEPSAPLGGGANAVAVERGEFAKVIEHPALAEALFFGMAYSAFTLIPERKAKGKHWTVIELGGPVIAAYGLTTRRGGFIPISLTDLKGLLQEADA